MPTENNGAPSARAYGSLRAAILHGEYGPGQALRPQALAAERGVSLAVARESLLRLVGEGLAERLPNRGFVVPQAGDLRWRQLAETRALIEPHMLRLSIANGDLEWETRVRAAHHRLAGTATHGAGDVHYSDEWAAAHYQFHRSLLEACGNDVLLDIFDRLWTSTELARRWSAANNPNRDAVTEHRQLERLALLRRPDEAAAALSAHVSATADVLTNQITNAGEPHAAR